MRHTIQIEEVTETRTSSGAVTESWSVKHIVRAEILPVSGREYFSAQTVNAQNTVKFNIRYLPGLTTKMRIVFKGRVFDLQTIINHKETNHSLSLMGVEHVQ